jgi:iron-sulfur cluster assembly protein
MIPIQSVQRNDGMNITCSNAAADYIAVMIKKNEGTHFRLSIKKTGCSGYSYFPSIIADINPHDEVVRVENGMSLYLDSAWLDLLQDIHIDYIEDDKSGLKQKRLVFTNPKEGNRCGCGESFQIKVNNEEK